MADKSRFITGLRLLGKLLPGERLKTATYLNLVMKPRTLLRRSLTDFYRFDHIYQVLDEVRRTYTGPFSILEFEGDDDVYRVSLGVARISGSADAYTGSKVWSGSGKSYGLLSSGGALYMWVSPGSDATGYREARLYRSTDHGAGWSQADWAFEQRDGLIFPTFLQFGKDGAGSRDGFVYVYANHLENSSALQVQKPGEIALLRVPAASIMDRTRYEFFAGPDANGNPRWTSRLAARAPAFVDPNGVGWNTSVSHDPGLGRYLLITEHTATAGGNIGIFDAPEPWGPWTTVHYAKRFGRSHVDTNTFFWSFAPKWYSADGLQCVMIFTGVGSNDSWNSVEGSFLPVADTAPRSRPER